MQYRQLGRSGLKISPICLGTMMFGGPTDEATSTRIVAKAREAGINFIDIYMRSGHYARSQTYQTPLPMTLGMEGAGTVAELGAGVADLRVGDRVAYCIVRGSYAEYGLSPRPCLARARRTPW